MTLFLLLQTIPIQVPPPPIDIPISNPSNIVNFFTQHAQTWVPTMILYAKVLFWALASIDLGVEVVVRSDSRPDLGQVMHILAQWVFHRGFFLGLLLNGPDWIMQIINSFVQLARQAADVKAVSPSQVLTDGWSIFSKLLAQASLRGALFDGVTSIGFLIAAAFIAIAFTICALHLIKFQVETVVAAFAGLIFLGFGGSRFSSTYTERYITLAIAAGVRYMVILLIIGLGHAFAIGVWMTMATAAPYSAAGIAKAWEVAAESCIFASLCWGTPTFVAGMLSGALTQSGHNLIGFVAPIAQAGIAGGTVVATAATGGVSGVATGGIGAIGKAAMAGLSGMGGAGSSGRNGSQPSPPRSSSSRSQPSAPNPSEA